MGNQNLANCCCVQMPLDINSIDEARNQDWNEIPSARNKPPGIKSDHPPSPKIKNKHATHRSRATNEPRERKSKP